MVSVRSGAIEFTRMPSLPSSSARLFVNCVTPALNAEYTAIIGMPRNASTVETLTMLPPSPCSTMRGANGGDALAVRSEVVRLARQIAYLETTITNADGELVSKASGQFILRRKEAK